MKWSIERRSDGCKVIQRGREGAVGKEEGWEGGGGGEGHGVGLLEGAAGELLAQWLSGKECRKRGFRRSDSQMGVER